MMNVEGVNISDEVLVNVCFDIQKLNNFTYADVQKSLTSHGVNWDVAYRAADRWLQRMKKQGNIAYKAKQWGWVKK